jgi:hypothetical protein
VWIGLATLSDIYTDERLKQSLEFEANTLASGVLINLGDTDSPTGVTQFRFQPLARRQRHDTPSPRQPMDADRPPVATRDPRTAELE